MPNDSNGLFGLAPLELEQLHDTPQTTVTGSEERRRFSNISEKFTSFTEIPEYKVLQVHRTVGKQMGILNPFFSCHETMAKNTTVIDGKEFKNFSTYDYLGLNGHPEIVAAATETMQRFGTSAGASRLVSGERPPHRDLEKAIASLYSVDDAVIFVSGHATNVSTISTLLGPKDVVYHDALSHNSLILGAVLSGAARHSFPHNDMGALEKLLQATRFKHERAIIITEGVFSMDGSIAHVSELIALKKQYTCFLMVDEAHSLGALGKTGRGIAEHFAFDSHEVDIWMGTFSKTLCGCGGYIAGCAELIELLKFRAPGFVYSVGMPPPIATASAKAVELMLREPERVAKLQYISKFFLEQAKERGFNTGYADGIAVVPVIVGNSLVAGRITAILFENCVNVLPIMYPVVEEGKARLRFFLSACHTEEDVTSTLDLLAKELPAVQEKFI